MTTKLYHKDIGYPAAVRRTLELLDERGLVLRLAYTPYALNRADIEAYRYDLGAGLLLPAVLVVSSDQIFEVELGPENIEKIGVRVPYNERYDLCLVIRGAENRVITVWLNQVGDNHLTLDRSRYDIPEN